MKRVIVIFSVALAFVFMSCDNGDVEEANPFVGTWELENNENVRFVFTKTVATGYINKGWVDNSIYWTGTYTYNNTHITVIADEELSAEEVVTSWPNGLIWEYKFEDDLLLLYNPALATFKKINTN